MSEKPQSENSGRSLATSDSLIGVTVDHGRYEIVKLIGEGGMGRVFQARQVSMNRMVALKILRAQLAADEALHARFQQEALSISRLRHPNTITIYDYGRTEDGYLFMAMELLGGKSLFSLLREERRLELPRTLHIMEQVAGAVAEAHDLGIVHRDLKPENIQIDQVGGDPDFAKVLDFGIAKIVHGERDQSGGKTLTMAGAIFGTPHYMSPEQVHGLKVDHRTDIYSLGIILYELLTGEPPFDGATPMAVMMAQASKPVPDIRQRCPEADLTDSTVELIRDCLVKERDDRLGTTRDLVQRINEIRYEIGEISSTRVFFDPQAAKGRPRGEGRPRRPSMVPETEVTELPPREDTSRPTPAHPIDAAADALHTPEHSGQVATIPPTSLHGDLEVPRSRVGVWIAAVVLLAAAAGGVYAWQSTDTAPQEATTTARPAGDDEPVRVTINAGGVSYVIESEPAGAEVALGDRVLGTTPLSKDFPENEATTLALTLDGHAPATLVLDGKPEGAGTRRVKLQPLGQAALPVAPDAPTPDPLAPPDPVAPPPGAAWLRIDSDPAGAQVYLGEQQIGTTPFEWKPAIETAEPLELSFRKDGYKPAMEKLTLAAAGAEAAPLSIKLQKKKRWGGRNGASAAQDEPTNGTAAAPELVPEPPPAPKKPPKKHPEKKPPPEEEPRPVYQKL